MQFEDQFSDRERPYRDSFEQAEDAARRAAADQLQNVQARLGAELQLAERTRFDCTNPRSLNDPQGAIARIGRGDVLSEGGDLHLVLGLETVGGVKSCRVLSYMDGRFYFGDGLKESTVRFGVSDINRIDEILQVKDSMPLAALAAANNPIVKHNAEVFIGLRKLGADFRRTTFANKRVVFLRTDEQGKIVGVDATPDGANFRIEVSSFLQVTSPYVTLMKEIAACETKEAVDRIQYGVELANVFKAADMRRVAREL